MAAEEYADFWQFTLVRGQRIVGRTGQGEGLFGGHGGTSLGCTFSFFGIVITGTKWMVHFTLGFYVCRNMRDNVQFFLWENTTQADGTIFENLLM